MHALQQQGSNLVKRGLLLCTPVEHRLLAASQQRHRFGDVSKMINEATGHLEEEGALFVPKGDAPSSANSVGLDATNVDQVSIPLSFMRMK